MVYIISGPIDSGKTTKLTAVFESLGRGAGFISRKIYVQRMILGYELVNLKTGEYRTLARNSDSLPPDWDETDRCGRFSFSGAAFRFGENIIEGAIEEGSAPFFLDEIGILELRGGGFAALLRKVLNTGGDVYLTARMDRVDNIVKEFDIIEWELVIL